MWHKIGLKRNIFFTHALKINKHDSSLLVGRNGEIGELMKEFDSIERGIKIITGEYGIGKTSFLNVLQFKMYYRKAPNKRLLPSIRKIIIDNESTYDDFLQEALLSLCTNIKEYYVNSRRAIPDSIKFQTDYWLGQIQYNNTTTREFGFDIKVLSVKHGASVSDSIYNKLDPYHSLQFLLKEFVKKSKMNGVFFHIDNLELIKSGKLISILNTSRDTLFNLNNSYWLLSSSDMNLWDNIYAQSKRFASIINGIPLNLKNLSNKEVIEAIDYRILSNKIDKNQLIPIMFTNNVVKNIYSFTDKDLRETFKILHYLSVKFFSYDHYVKALIENKDPLEYEIVGDELVELCIRYTSNLNLTPTELKMLDFIFLNSPCTILKINKKSFYSPKTINKRINELASKGLLKYSTPKTIDLTFRLKTLAMSNKLSKKSNEIATREILMNY